MNVKASHRCVGAHRPCRDAQVQQSGPHLPDRVFILAGSRHAFLVYRFDSTLMQLSSAPVLGGRGRGSVGFTASIARVVSWRWRWLRIYGNPRGGVNAMCRWLRI